MPLGVLEVDGRGRVVEDGIESGLAFHHRPLAPLELGDIGAHGNGAAIVGAVIVDQQPMTVIEPLLDRSVELAEDSQALGDPRLFMALGIGEQTALDPGPHQILETHADTAAIGDAGIHFIDRAIREHEPILGIVKSEALGKALNGVVKLASRRFGPRLAVLERGMDASLLGIRAYQHQRRHNQCDGGRRGRDQDVLPVPVEWNLPVVVDQQRPEAIFQQEFPNRR